MELAGTDWRRTLKAPVWFRSVPAEFPCMVPLYVIERKEWFHWFRYSTLAAIACENSATFPALLPGENAMIAILGTH